MKPRVQKSALVCHLILRQRLPVREVQRAMLVAGTKNHEPQSFRTFMHLEPDSLLLVRIEEGRPLKDVEGGAHVSLSDDQRMEDS